MTEEEKKVFDISLEEIIKSIEVKDYLTLVDKHFIFEKVMEMSIGQINDFYYVDSIMFDAVFYVTLLTMKTNFYEVYEDYSIDYEYLKYIKLFENDNKIYDTEMKNLYNDIYTTLTFYAHDLNSLGNKLSNTLKEMQKSIPTAKDLNKLLNKLPKVLNAVKPEVISTVTKEIKQGKLDNIVKLENGIKK